MVGAMAEMALLRTPIAPLGSPLSSRGFFSARYLNHFDAFSGTQNAVSGGEAQKRAGVAHLGLKVCCARASVGEDRHDDRKERQTFPPPVVEWGSIRLQNAQIQWKRQGRKGLLGRVRGELQYFGKLSASCVAGALLVKYGSLCVPSVTTPNLNLALLMIVTPCLMSVALLTLASILGSDGNTRKQ